MDSATRERPKRRGTWIVVFVGLLEIAAIVAFFELKGFAGAVCVAAGAVQGFGSAQAALGGAQGGGQTGGEPSGGAASQPVVASPAQPRAGGSTAGVSAPAPAGDARVHGDTNQVVDPDCVGKTAAGLLSSSDAPATGPTCGPMKQPAELKAAEQQISH